MMLSEVAKRMAERKARQEGVDALGMRGVPLPEQLLLLQGKTTTTDKNSNNSNTSCGRHTAVSFCPPPSPSIDASNLRKSCDNCVKLKRACNGESPCRLCARMRKVCCFSAKKRSGPRKGTKYNTRRAHNSNKGTTPQTQQYGEAVRGGHLQQYTLDAEWHRATKRRAEDGGGETSFVRRANNKIQRLPTVDPASKVTSFAEQPAEAGDVTRPLPAIEEGALLLLRKLKTFRPSSETMGSTPLEPARHYPQEEPKQQTQRLPSLFDMGAVSSPPAHLSDALHRRAFSYGTQSLAQSVTGTATPRRRLQEITHPRVGKGCAFPSLATRVILSEPAAPVMVPSFPRYVRAPIEDVPCAQPYHATPLYGGEAIVWEPRAVTPSQPVCDPYAQDWVPVPQSFASRGKSGMCSTWRAGGSAPSAIGRTRSGGYAEYVPYHRVETKGFPVAPAGVGRGGSGMGVRFDRCSTSARYLYAKTY